MSNSRVDNCNSSALHTLLCRQQLGKQEVDGSAVLCPWISGFLLLAKKH